MVCRIVISGSVCQQVWDNACEEERGKKDGAEICHKWRVDAECGRVQVPRMRD